MKKLLLFLFLCSCATFKKTQTYKEIEKVEEKVNNINTQYQKLVTKKPQCLDFELNNNIVKVNEEINSLKVSFEVDYNKLKHQVDKYKYISTLELLIIIGLVYLIIKKK